MESATKPRHLPCLVLRDFYVDQPTRRVPVMTYAGITLSTAFLVSNIYDYRDPIYRDYQDFLHAERNSFAVEKNFRFCVRNTYRRFNTA